MHMRRRGFLEVTAAFGGLVVSAPVLSMIRYDHSMSHEFSDLLFIGSDGTIRVILSKVEFGQGISTTLPMLVAEELDCDWKKMTVELRRSGKGKDFEENIYVLSTGGSDSTRSEFWRYRMAGATSRMMLINAAAKRWNVSPESCTTEMVLCATKVNR